MDHHPPSNGQEKAPGHEKRTRNQSHIQITSKGKIWTLKFNCTDLHSETTFLGESHGAQSCLRAPTCPLPPDLHRAHSHTCPHLATMLPQLKLQILRASLVVQWIKLHTPNAEDRGVIPGQKTRSHRLAWPPKLHILLHLSYIFIKKIFLNTEI